MSIWYARKGSCNIDEVSGGTTSDVWNTTPVSGGTFLDWSTQPSSGDIFCANGFSAILINIDLNLGTGRISTASEGTGSAGGGFTIGATHTITTNILATGSTCLTTTTGNFTLTVYGNISISYGGYGLLNVFVGFNLIIYGNIIGGLFAYSGWCGYRSTNSGNTTITGNVTGGATECHGVDTRYASANVVIVNGNVNAGTGGYGLLCALAPTVNNGNIINSTTASAIFGPFKYNPGATNYIQYPGPGASTKKLGVEPAIGDIRYLTAIGSNVGICKIPTAVNVLDSALVDAGSGTYHEAAVTAVQAGVTYGPGSAYLGTFAAGGSPLVGEGLVD